MLGIELIVVVITKLTAEEGKIDVADDDAPTLSQGGHNGFLPVDTAGILQGLVIIAESAHLHAVKAAVVLDADVKVADQIAGEVETRQLEKQLVLIDRVGTIDHHEREVGVALIGELLRIDGITVGKDFRAAIPHIAQVELATMEPTASVDSIDDHTGHFAHLTLGKLLDKFFHVGHAAVGVARVEPAQTTDEQELVAIGSQGEARGGDMGVARHLRESVSLEGIVGGGIERVLKMHSLAGILGEVRIGEQHRPLALGIIGFQLLHVGLGCGMVALPAIEQEEMIVDICHLLILGILGEQPVELLLAQRQVVEFVLEDDTAVEESVHDDGIAGRNLLFGEGNLLEIVFTLVGVVLGRVLDVLQRVADGLGGGDGVLLLLREFLLVEAGHDGLVHALPVVHILPFAPQALELRLALAHRQGIVEIPRAALLVLRWGIDLVSVLVVVLKPRVAILLRVGLCLFVALLLLFFLQGLYHAVDGGIAALLVHLGECLQGVLQVYGVGERHQLVEHLGAFGQLLVVGTLLVEQSDGLAVATLGVIVFLKIPIQVAQLEQQHTFLYPRAGCLLVAFLVGRNGSGGVALCQVDVADGIIHLVEIVLVVVVGGHAFQPADHLLRLSLRQHLGHGNAGVEVELVGRGKPSDVAVGLVSLALVAHGFLQLAHEEPLARLLLAAYLVLDALAQIGNGLGVVARMDVIVGIGEVPFLACAPVDAVALHVAHHILGIVKPALLNIAFGQPSPRTAINGGLRLIEAAHIREGGGGLIEVALVEL